jgi:heme/copper-type cytochrome/quinol oxidase subunit 3
VSVAAPARTALGRPPLLGTALFIASESIFFLAIVVAYIALRAGGLAAAKSELDVGRTLVFSLFLFSSSATMSLAERRGSRSWLAATAALGAVFLTGQGLEYARLLGGGIAPSSGLFGTTFFTLTGLHALHVLGGLAAIAVLYVASSLRPSRVGGAAWDAVAWYWHFVDGVWVVVFSVVYLGTVLS